MKYKETFGHYTHAYIYKGDPCYQITTAKIYEYICRSNILCVIKSTFQNVFDENKRCT